MYHTKSTIITALATAGTSLWSGGPDEAEIRSQPSERHRTSSTQEDLILRRSRHATRNVAQTRTYTL